MIRILRIFTLLALLSSGAVYAQVGTVGRGTVVDARIDFLGHTVNGSSFVINYKIPFNGMVEIRLYDAKGNKIWQSQYENQMGENRIVLKASKFQSGELYTYVLNYKRDELRQEFSIPNE